MNVAVVDSNGDLIAFERMDGAQLASISISQHKARAAARYRRECTAALFAQCDCRRIVQAGYEKNRTRAQGRASGLESVGPHALPVDRHAAQVDTL